MESSQAQVTMALAYDITFRIFDHNQSSSPLDSVAYHEAEEYFHHSGIFRTIERFHRLDLYNRFGLSLTEFLSLPHDYVTAITEITLETIRTEEKTQQQLEQAYQQEEQKTGQSLVNQHGLESRNLWGIHQRKR